MDRRQDLAVALGIIAVGALYFWLGGIVIGPEAKSEPLGTQFWPRLLALLMMGGATWVAGTILVKWPRQLGHTVENLGDPDEPDIPVRVVRPLVLLGLLTVYAATYEYLGYVAGTTIGTYLAFVIFGRRDWKRIAVASVTFAVVLYIVFGLVLRVRLDLIPGWVR
jgi:hypothetical protein